MPNYCNNTLTIRGNQKQLLNFFMKNENIENKQELDFAKSVPRPKNCYMGDLGPVSYTHLTLPTICSV